MGKPTAKSSGKIVGRGRTGGHNAKPMQKKKKSKLVVTFDPEKRKCVSLARLFGGVAVWVDAMETDWSSREYLTGFHKRKQERRRFGLDMEAFKQKKRLMEAKKQVRAPPATSLIASYRRWTHWCTAVAASPGDAATRGAKGATQGAQH
jgi:hypothetical protein